MRARARARVCVCVCVCRLGGGEVKCFVTSSGLLRALRGARAGFRCFGILNFCGLSYAWSQGSGFGILRADVAYGLVHRIPRRRKRMTEETSRPCKAYQDVGVSENRGTLYWGFLQ